MADGVAAGGVTSPVPVLRPTVSSGTLQGVVVTAADGSQITGAGAADGSWSPEEPLELGASYTAVASAVNADGQVVSVSLPFSVTGEDGAVRAKLMPLDGEVVGVGMPVVVIFTREVPKAERAKLVEAIQLVTKAPDGSSVEGAWRWIGADRVHWRPKVYWPSGTSVSVKVPMTKVQVGGAWGAADRDVAFTVGDAHVSTADTDTHQMTVRVNGEVARVIPISAGREDSDPAFVTRSGVHLVLEKHADYLMDGRTVGQDYATQVKWATRIANSGEFVHGAPWSVPSQGKRNVSHGCLNVSDANAKWFFDLSQRGDVVDVTGTDRAMELTNGLGDWVLSWEQWTAPQV
ncbi:Lipoprotein-anchoring transpeptidase ErfK/SrfK [Quadrisphaera granulorum]|uniref:Lipoprotein-anchoring transpeptidase ErfK/SrfK n=1 Tax=Quadrisphaera granulorum TaxID=317664 RepID=A0A315ZQL7_9ACTN|nr:lipoprotein-anchoring transpeptidase ErfK/SrfK [Quadrisphaera granulorum]SZE98702.1 Lipoprotein-anchoring transpeptidase ErfK/SrfK [Quadrisphaera granulorum]